MSPTPTSPPDEPEVLWRPPADVRSTTRIGAYLGWLERELGLRFTDYSRLWEWSVTDLDAFWGSIWDHFGVQAASPPERVLGNADGSGRGMPGARWFPGSRVNYAAQALEPGAVDGGAVAMVAHSQSRGRVELTWAELRDRGGPGRGGPPARSACGPATGSRPTSRTSPRPSWRSWPPPALGAVWSSCAPEFGTRSVIDRFAADRADRAAGRRRLPLRRQGHRPRRRGRRRSAPRCRRSRATVAVPYLDPHAPPTPGATRLVASCGRTAPADLSRRAGAVRPPALHPLLLGHHRPAQADRARPRRHHARAPQGARPARRPRPRRPLLLVLHHRLDDVELPGRRACWSGRPSCSSTATRASPTSTRCGGSPGRAASPASAPAPPFLLACRKAGLEPGRDARPRRAARHRLHRRAAAGRGLPLGARARRRPRVLLASISGGTDVCTAFVGAVPLLPVRAGEIPCRLLGAAVEAVRRRRAPRSSASWASS